MDFSTLIFLIFGMPLILVALGFFLLCLRWLTTRDQRANQAKILEAATKLDANLARLEVRLTALEDILLPPKPQPRADQNMTPQEFDRRLAQTTSGSGV
jgi:hypothetical protein